EGRGFDRQYFYYHGLALQKLGKEKEAKKLFENMLKDVQDRSRSRMYIGQFGGRNTRQTMMANNHYLTGLAYEGLGEKDKARKEFEQALDINPGHVWSRQHLSEL
ncbi:MAG: tetratricopeptide repeat protein, partial [Ignavibacteriaceae bacterium]